MTLVGATASRDTADSGGALYNYNFGTLILTAGTNVLDSYASNVGGGIINFGTLRVTSSTIRGNTSVNKGGGIHNFAAAQVSLTDAQVSGNAASTGGGLYNYTNGIVTLVGQTSVCGNSASSPPVNIANLGNLSGTNYGEVGSVDACAIQ